MAGQSDPFEPFDHLFSPDSPFARGFNKAKADAKNKPEKGLPWAAKEIGGKLYVPLEQVIELLQQNDVLPAVRRGLERHINQKKEK